MRAASRPDQVPRLRRFHHVHPGWVVTPLYVYEYELSDLIDRLETLA